MTNLEKLNIYLNKQQMNKLNTGIRYNDSEAMKRLKDGEMYVGMFHGRSNPNQRLDEWGSDGFVYGPISKFIVEDFNKMSLVDMDGKIIPLPVHEDMVCADGHEYGEIKQHYYGDITVFVQGVEIPLRTSEKYPIAAYPYNGEEVVLKRLSPSIYIDAQNTIDEERVLRKRALIGPVTAIHTTYLYNIRMNVNHISGEWNELSFNHTDLVDGEFNKVEYFVVK